jgi:hypothetical protein
MEQIDRQRKRLSISVYSKALTDGGMARALYHFTTATRGYVCRTSSIFFSPANIKHYDVAAVSEGQAAWTAGKD